MNTVFPTGLKSPAMVLAVAAAAMALALRQPATDITFLIAPVAKVLGWFTGEGYAHEGDGMAFHGMGIVIDRSCSGATFLIVLLTISALLVWRSHANARRTCVWAAAFFVLAYPVTLVVNSARIIGILQVQRLLGPLSPASHEALGAFMLLGFLLMFSLLATRLMRPAPDTSAPMDGDETDETHARAA